MGSCLRKEEPTNIVIRNHGTYDVEKLWKLAKSLPVESMEISRLEPILDAELWEENGEVITPKQVLANPESAPRHTKAIRNADMTHPVLIFDTEHGLYSHLRRSDNFNIKIPGDYDVLDGLHRICHAIFRTRKHIKIQLITWETLQKAKIEEFQFPCELDEAEGEGEANSSGSSDEEEGAGNYKEVATNDNDNSSASSSENEDEKKLVTSRDDNE